MLKLCIIAIITNIIVGSVLLIAALGDGLLSSLYFIEIWIWFNLYLYYLRIVEER
jgi:hypothetical protein